MNLINPFSFTFLFANLIFSSSQAITQQSINIENQKLELQTYQESVSGRYFFAINSKNKNTPSIATLAIIDATNAKILFSRFFKSLSKKIQIKHTHEIQPGYLHYQINLRENSFDKLKNYFLDTNFDDVMLLSIPEDKNKSGAQEIIWSEKNQYIVATGKQLQSRDNKGKFDFTWENTKNIDTLQLDHQDILMTVDQSDEISKLSYPNGKILWKLSAKTWKFKNDVREGFYHLHDFKRLNDGHLLLLEFGSHDDSARVVEYAIDEKNKTADLVWQYIAPYQFSSPLHGSVQRLSNGNTLIAWGDPMKRSPLFFEVNHDGNLVRSLAGSSEIYIDGVFFIASNESK